MDQQEKRGRGRPPKDPKDRGGNLNVYYPAGVIKSVDEIGAKLGKSRGEVIGMGVALLKRKIMREAKKTKDQS